MTNKYIVYTMQSGGFLHFEWNRSKEWANFNKHGLMFTDALGLWEDPLAIEFCDDIYGEESRFLRRGFNETGLFVVVVFTERETDIIRIISARLGTLKERRIHEGRV